MIKKRTGTPLKKQAGNRQTTLPVRVLTLAATVVWIVALYFPAFIKADDPTSYWTGAAAFTNGLVFAWAALFGQSTVFLSLAWFANVFFCLSVVQNFRNKAEGIGARVFGIALLTLPLGALTYSGTLMFSNESDIGKATIGLATYLWYMALLLTSVPANFHTIKHLTNEWKLATSR